MTRTKIVFSYTEAQDFEEPLEITMEVPERNIDEMCEYFQRFLSACGYVFDVGENIKPVKNEADYPVCAGDTLTFNDDGSPFIYDFWNGNNKNCYGGVKPYSGVRGGMAEDIIKF